MPGCGRTRVVVRPLLAGRASPLAETMIAKRNQRKRKNKAIVGWAGLPAHAVSISMGDKSPILRASLPVFRLLSFFSALQLFFPFRVPCGEDRLLRPRRAEAGIRHRIPAAPQGNGRAGELSCRKRAI